MQGSAHPPDWQSIDTVHRFDAVYTSHEFGAPKEDAAFWPRLAAKESFDPSRTLFADDSPTVQRAPIEFPGIVSVRELAAGLAPAGASA